MQIKSVVLFGYNNERRILSLNPGSVNIITGKSQTGKSVIGDIIDYCFGRTSCNIAEGVVRDKVAWYALHLEHNGELMFIARQNPPQGQASTNKSLYLLGAQEIPDDISRMSPIDNHGLEKLLSEKIGISDNLFKPPSNQSRHELSANIRHTLYYCIQNQDELASQKVLFHRQSEDFMSQAIKDTLPYFLGVINDDSIHLEYERAQLRREANIIQRRIKEVELLKGNGLDRAMSLLTEAREVGLISDYDKASLIDYNNVRSLLEQICEWKPVEIKIVGMDRISMLQNQLQEKQNELEDLSIDIRSAEEFFDQVKGYSKEMAHQRNRLQSIGLFKILDFDQNHCPFCSKELTDPFPGVVDIQNAIKSLDNKLSIVTCENPQLQRHIDSLNEKRKKLREDIKSFEVEINAIYNENSEAIKLKDLNSRRAKVIGRISLWLESVIISDNTFKETEQLKKIEARIDEIEKLLNTDDIEERKQSAINQVSQSISEWAKNLELEHCEFPYRFDLNRLTVMVDRNRPVPLQELGSAANWLGCHLIALFALHKFFHEHKRPVPGILFLDQPSQVFFPPELNNNNQIDTKELRKIYRFIFDRVREICPNLQVIIVDHADIAEDYFQKSVIEKWWDDTHKLVPITW